MILSSMLSALRVELQDLDESLYTDGELNRAIEKTVSLMSRLLPKRSMLEVTLTTGMIKGTYLLDISSSLSDFIKIERVEYETEQSPPCYPTFDILGSYLMFRAGVSTLTAGNAMRIIYLGKWSPPTQSAEGDYPSHLDDPIIIGSAGQVLIYMAERQVQAALTAITSVGTILSGIDSITLTLPSLTVPTAPTLSIPTAPTAYSFVKPTAPTLPDIPTAPAAFTGSAPTAPTLSDITPPTVYTYSKPTAPTFPGAPSAPTAPTLDFSAAETALDDAATKVDTATGYLTTGAAYINAATRGEDVGATYGQYCTALAGAAQTSVNEGIARLREIDNTLEKYGGQISVYQAEVNKWASEVQGQVNSYRAEISAEEAGINNFAAKVSLYRSEIDEESMKLTKFQREVEAFHSEVVAYGGKLEGYRSEIQGYTAKVNALVGLFQAQAQVESAGVNAYASEVQAYRTSVEAENLKLVKFTEEVKAYQAQVANTRNVIDEYSSKIKALVDKASIANTQPDQYLNVAGRYLSSGQAKINEFLAALGFKPEFTNQRASAEQRTT